MKKIISVFAFLTIVISANAQFGVGFYPTSNMVSFRFHPLIKTKLDSAPHLKCETNFSSHVELRSTFSYTFNHNASAQPELISFFRVAGEVKNEPGLMTGFGFYYRYSGGSSAGIILPFLIEWAPQFKNENHLIFDAEMDLMMKLSGTPKLTLRPLVGVSWLFDSPKVKASNMMKRN